MRCGAVDARLGHQRRRSWQTRYHHEPGHVFALPRRQGEPPVQGGQFKTGRPNKPCPLGVCCAKACRVTGNRLHVCAHLVGHRLSGASPWSLGPEAFPWRNHRRLCKADRRLANLDIDEDTVCAPLSADCFAIRWPSVECLHLPSGACPLPGDGCAGTGNLAKKNAG